MLQKVAENQKPKKASLEEKTEAVVKAGMMEIAEALSRTQKDWLAHGLAEDVSAVQTLAEDRAEEFLDAFGETFETIETVAGAEGFMGSHTGAASRIVRALKAAGDFMFEKV